MRLHSLLLHLYPASFRAEYGQELSHIFWRRRQQATNPLSVLYVWLSEFLDILYNAVHAHWDILCQDLRYTFRTLARTPGFTIAAIIITGLGIGANTAVFSITDDVLLRPLPFADSDRLVQLWQHPPGYSRVELSPPNFQDWRRLSTSFEAMAAYSGIAANFISNGEPRRLEGSRVTPEFFSILGREPLIGRAITEADVSPGSARTVILSYELWQAAFGGTPDIVGKNVRLDNDFFTVIGVMPADFFFPLRGTQIWTPLDVSDPRNFARDNLFLDGIAKLKLGVSLEKARAEMDVIADQLASQYPKENDKTGAVVVPLGDQVSSQTRLLLWALFGASLCVLLIACTNLASLLLARSMGRRKELTVRAAMGAGRERLVRQLLTESLVLSFSGGLAGIVIAAVALPLLTVLVPPTLPIGDATILDARVFGFAAMITLGTGLLFGVFPALRMCAGTDSAGLREGSRGGVGGRRERLRSALVVAEITISVVLLISAGLLIRALWRIQSIDPGFHADSVLTMQTSLPMPRYAPTATRATFYTEVLSQVRALPGVTNAALISSLPMLQGGGIWPVAVSGEQAVNPAGTNNVAMRFVTPGYFESLGIPLRSGRDVSEADTLDTPLAAVVSESFAQRYWPNQDAIGRQFHFAMDSFPFAMLDRTIIGVAGDVRFRGLERDSEPQVYLAYKQVPDGSAIFYAPKELVIGTSSNSTALVPAVRSIIRKADPELPIAAVRPLREVVDLQTAPRTTQIRLVAAFAALALILAGIGIHGLLSFAVGQRSPEFGLRIALGAQSRDILSMVFREGLLLALIGTTLGLILSFYAGRWMQGLLAGIAPSDPATLIVSGIVALSMTLSGTLLPALRAVRIDASTIIRGE